MAKIYIEASVMTSIADAIREMNDEDTSYYPSEMPDAIRRIATDSIEISYVTRTLTEYVDEDNLSDVGSYAFAGCSALSTVSFPECTTIEDDAFQDCTALSTLSFPKCTKIGSFAFYSCSTLESLYLMNDDVVNLTNINAFVYTPMSDSSYLGYYGSIYVPSTLADAYKTATNWRYYADRIVGI